MSIRMSKLEFFCNRPTLVALIGFGLDISSVNYVVTGSDIRKTSEDESLMKKEKTEDTGHVKGLLGYGKGRVVFFLGMNVDSVSVHLNKEDGSQLAMFVQESFLLDIKVMLILLLATSFSLSLFYFNIVKHEFIL
jgi:vacuolar protein sorting-associated protein 13A/C